MSSAKPTSPPAALNSVGSASETDSEELRLSDSESESPSDEDDISVLPESLARVAKFESTLIFYLNGRKQTVRDPNPEGTLLDYIRDVAGLTGTKLGCAEGGCGACTVVCASWDAATKRVEYCALNACIVPLVAVEGKHLITVEGLGSSEQPHAVQERISVFHGSQCGFCTPGIVMSLYAVLRNNDGQPTEEQISEAFDGNLCRCTGYKPIIQAASTFTCGRKGGCCRDKPAESSGKEKADCCSSDVSASNCCKSATSNSVISPGGVTPDGQSYKPYTSDTELIFPPALKRYVRKPLFFGNPRKVWFRPTTKQQLLLIKQQYPDCKIVGGASEIQIEIKMKGAQYPVAVFANDIDELRFFRYEPGRGVEFGANISISHLEYKLEELCTQLGDEGQAFRAIVSQLKYFAGRQIRNAATPAGNIATASPISDLNPCLVACDAVVTVESLSDGSVELPMDGFFVAYRQTRLPRNGLITKIFIPETAPHEFCCSYKQSKRKDDDIAIVTACLRLRLDDSDEKIVQAKLAYGGMAPITATAPLTQEFLVGRSILSPETLEEAVNCLERDFDLPYGVPGGMAVYRRTLKISFFYKFYQHVLSKISRGRTEIPLEPDALATITRRPADGTRDTDNPYAMRVVGQSTMHLSALKQTTGEAQYVDDIPPQHNELFAVLVTSERARARIRSVDTSAALAVDCVVGWVDAADLPNREANYWGNFAFGKETFFAEDEVFVYGQTIGVICATNRERAYEAARKVKIEYEDLPYIVTLEEAIAAQSFFPDRRVVEKGDVAAAFANSAHVFSGECRFGAQEHFYLEPQGCLAIPEEGGEMKIYASTQNPNETQLLAAQVLGVPANRVVCRAKRLGGGFGGKETRSCVMSSLAAVCAKKFRRPTRMILSRYEDMLVSGQRHPFLVRWQVGLDEQLKFTGLKMELYANAGWSMDLTRGVIDRAVYHASNTYHFPTAHISGVPCRTNVASNTAFRGFGGPQGMFACESMVYEVAHRLGVDVEELRSRNYYDPSAGQKTPYLQDVGEDFTVPELVTELKREVQYDKLREEVDAFNREHKWIKRGLAHVPTAFGVSFGVLFLNQAGALIHIYHDGTILVSHGGTEMGQGLHTKMAMIAAEELKVPLDNVFISETSTQVVANASATAASAGSDLNGGAVKNACDQLNARLEPYRKKLGPNATMHEIAAAAYADRVNLSANGFYKTPKIGYEWGNNVDPKPAFLYFTQGSAVSMVEVDLLTGDWACLRTDIKMDIGRPLNKAIDYGQIEGAYVQGQGLFTIEESLWFRHNGALFTRGPGNYKIPGFRDTPQEFNVSMLRNRDFSHLETIHRSKGIGEPPLFLGSAPMWAIRDALKAARKDNGIEEFLPVESPLTSERIRLAVGDHLLQKSLVQPKEGEANFFLRA